MNQHYTSEFDSSTSEVRSSNESNQEFDSVFLFLNYKLLRIITLDEFSYEEVNVEDKYVNEYDLQIDYAF